MGPRPKPKSFRYVQPRRIWTAEERLEALERIAHRLERGEGTPIDEIEALVHLRELGLGYPER